jgi:hypothetical protein
MLKRSKNQIAFGKAVTRSLIKRLYKTIKKYEQGGMGEKSG